MEMTSKAMTQIAFLALSALVLPANTGTKPVIESWLHPPEHAVPETTPETFTASVLDFLKVFPAAAWVRKAGVPF